MHSLTLPALSWRPHSPVPMVFQAEAAECGLACLCMMAQYHQDGRDLGALRQEFGLSGRGLTLQQLMQIANAMQLSTRAVKAELEDLHELQLPAILHWDMQHFVVVTRVTRQAVWIQDPALGLRKLSWAQVSEHFTGIALEVSPTAAFEPAKPGPRLTLRHFWQHAQGIKRSLALVFVLSILLQLFALASPYYMQTVIDEVLQSQAAGLLTVLALGFGLLLLIETLTGWCRQWVILGFASRLQLQMSHNLFAHLLRLPADYFSKRHLGDIVSRFGSLGQIRDQLTTGLVTTVLDGIMALLMLIVMALYSPTLTLVVVGCVAAFALLRLVTYRHLAQLNTEQLQNQAKEQSHFMESMRSIVTIKQLDYQAQRHNQWANHLTSSLNSAVRIGKIDIHINTINQLLFGLENIVVVYLAAHAVMDAALSVGMLYAFMSYKSRFTSAASTLINQLIQLRLLRVHLLRLADMVFCPAEPQQRARLPETSTTGAASLSVSGLGYRHGSLEAELFSQVSLEIPAGACVAIVGPSGAGKSTLLKCLMGLIQPGTGTVTCDHQPVHGNPTFRQHSAAVLQDDACLSGSIMANLTGFDEQPCPERMVWAARQACLHDDILAMPMQYQTLIGDMGSSLSGGQQQRLLLARALYRQPRILFLDEASSHLDVANEARINAHLQALAITRIIVAHRPDTIAMADTVYALENGQLRRIDKPAQPVAGPLIL